MFTPLFNKPKIKEAFLNYDPNYLIRELETILFPASEVEVVRVVDEDVFEIKSPQYESVKPLYILKNFLSHKPKIDQKISLEIPSKKTIYDSLINFPKRPYIWGGNTKEGVVELLEWIAPKKTLSSFDYNYYKLKGVDCSGLLYYVTNGNSIRNTSDMLLKYSEVKTLKSLDLIAWRGHVIIYLSEDLVIESRHPDGITRSKFSKRMKEIEKYEPKFFRFL
jgi:hypothetical protein